MRKWDCECRKGTGIVNVDEESGIVNVEEGNGIVNIVEGSGIVYVEKVLRL